jgi:hypothetical protein
MHDTTEAPNPQLYVNQKKWAWRLQGEQLCIQTCPVCNNSNWKFFINKTNGLNDCKVCNWEGNLITLKIKLGDPLDSGNDLGIESMREQRRGTATCRCASRHRGDARGAAPARRRDGVPHLRVRLQRGDDQGAEARRRYTSGIRVARPQIP